MAAILLNLVIMWMNNHKSELLFYSDYYDCRIVDVYELGISYQTAFENWKIADKLSDTGREWLDQNRKLMTEEQIVKVELVLEYQNQRKCAWKFLMNALDEKADYAFRRSCIWYLKDSLAVLSFGMDIGYWGMRVMPPPVPGVIWPE